MAHRGRLSVIPIMLWLVAAPSTSLACAACGCSLSSDAAMGYAATSGWRFNLQYTYLDQSALRYGSSAISPADVAAINDAGGEQEVEGRTINRYTTLGITWAPSANWNLKLQLPYIDRSHTTFAEASNPLTQDKLSSATLSGLGDVKLIGSYQGFLPIHNVGVQLGVKLPTGDYGGPAADGMGIAGNHPQTFTTGPLSHEASPDNIVDTNLQPGTGSTDLILGGYFYKAISQNYDVTVNGQFEVAVHERLDQAGADFRPGNRGTVSIGLRYEANPELIPQLQLNVTHKGSDQGALADVDNTAGTVAYLSPGVGVHVAGSLEAYGFVQVPVYRHLDGYQLLPRWTATVGVSYAL